MKNKIKKFISIITILAIVCIQTFPVYVYAEEPTPTPTTSPPSAEVTSTPSPDQQVTTQISPTPQPEADQSLVETPSVSPTPDPLSILTTPQTAPLSDAEREARKAAAKAAWEQMYYASHPELFGHVSDNGTGNTVLQTGPVTNSAAAVTSGNTNASSLLPQGAVDGLPNGISAANIGNGAVSDNSSTITNGAGIATDQTNSAKVGNNVNQSSITGRSSISFNVGDSTLTTGDANVTGTAITGANTNLSNVRVSEFNVVDTQKGDIILSPEAFAANCISGCSGVSAANSNNGALSTNTANATNNLTSNTSQTNTAGIGNNLTLAADSGNNTGSFNTGGDTTINTGDANVAANSLTFVNNNIAGGVTFGVVNIFGNLEGDIILPEFTSAPSGTVASNTGNGATSTNDASATNNTNTSTFQNNDVTIANNLILNGQTGDNSTSDNTSGNTTTNTGSSDVSSKVLNIANNNVTGGTWWLVIVNQAGNWVGHLLGAPDGSTMAGSPGTELKTDANGQISATNTGNGAGSDNTSNVSNTTNTNTNQSNNADIQNNLNLSANTGSNRTDFNTGGHNIINTGDSKILANMINFVNNNIAGTGNLVVTFVNVFGSWTGDFVTPGQQKHPSASSGQDVNSNNNVSSESGPNLNPTGNTTISTTFDPTPQSAPISVTNPSTRSQNTTGGSADTTSGSSENTSSSDDVTVAGISASAVGSDASKVMGSDQKVITVNLAWLLLLVPLIMFGLVAKILINRGSRR